MGIGRVRLVDVGARSMPGRGALFMLRVEMLEYGTRMLSVVCVRCMMAVVYVCIGECLCRCLCLWLLLMVMGEEAVQRGDTRACCLRAGARVVLI